MLDLFKTLMVSMFKSPVTVAYPQKPMQYGEAIRGHIDIDIDACIFCGICRRKCPTQAIEVDKNEQTWAIERFRCIQCGSCVEVCPKKCLSTASGLPPASAAMTKDLIHGARVSADGANHPNS